MEDYTSALENHIHLKIIEAFGPEVKPGYDSLLLRELEFYNKVSLIDRARTLRREMRGLPSSEVLGHLLKEQENDGILLLVQNWYNQDMNADQTLDLLYGKLEA